MRCPKYGSTVTWLVYLVDSKFLKILHAASCCVPTLVAWKPPGHVKGSAHLIPSWAEHDEIRCSKKGLPMPNPEKKLGAEVLMSNIWVTPKPPEHSKLLRMPRAFQNHLVDSENTLTQPNFNAIHINQTWLS